MLRTTTSTTSERGFALLEVVCCIAVLAIAMAATLGAVAAVARNAENGATRDAAMMVAENAMARARAAADYVPSAQANPDTASQNASWAFAANASYTAGARLLGPALCAAGSKTLQLPVTTSYSSSTNAFTVNVTYPRDPCAASGVTATLVLTQTLPAPHYVPGTTLVRSIPVPVKM